METSTIYVCMIKGVGYICNNCMFSALPEQSLVFMAAMAGATPPDQKGCQFYDKERSDACLRGFHSMYEQQLLCDVTLVAQGEDFPCHRAMLAASSPYFQAMFGGNFTEKNTEKVTLNEVTSVTLQTLLKYLYSGKITIEEEGVQSIFNSAHMLQLTDLEEICVNFMMQRITEKNCLGIYFFAKSYNRTELRNSACQKICSKFSKVTRQLEFLQLPAENVAEVLSFSNISHVSEEDVYAAALRWFENDLPDRQSDIFKVMQSVRFIHMDECFFREKVKSKSLFKSCKQLQALFEQVIYYINHPYRWHEVDLTLEPRKGEKYMYPRPILYTVNNYINGETQLEAYMINQPDLRTMPVDFPSDELRNPTMAVMDDVYLAGGTGSNAKALYKFDVRFTGKIFKLSNMRHGRSYFVPVDRFLYVLGGCHKNSNTDSVEKYIIEKNQWIKVAPLPCRLRCMCATSYRGKLYVFGGEMQCKIKGNKSRFLSNHVFCYDPETDRWKTLRPMKSARALGDCAVYKGKIYVIGGMGAMSDLWEKSEEPRHYLSTCEIFDPATNMWIMGPNLPRGMCGMGVVKYYGTIYLLGGLQDNQPSREVYYLSKSGDSWLPAPNSMYHGSLLSVSIHSSFIPVSLRDYIICANSESESESTNFGTSMDHFDINSDSNSDSDSSQSSRSYRLRYQGAANMWDSSSSHSSVSLAFDA